MTPHRRSSFSTLAVGVAAGVLAAAAGADPLGATTASATLVLLLTVAVCWLGSTAPRRLLAWTVLVAGVASLWVPGILAGFVVFALVYVVEPRRGEPERSAWVEPVVNAALAGVAVNLAARSQLEVFLGLSALVAVAIGAVIAIAGLSGQSRTVRRVVLFTTLGLVSMAVVATAALAAVSATVVDELREGERLVREGLEHLGDADLDAAIESLYSANTEFSKAEGRLSSLLLRPAAAVPVVAQHREAAVTLSSEAADVTELVTGLLEDVGSDALTVSGARIDLERISTFDDSLREIDASLARLDAEIDRVGSPWLVAPVSSRLDDLSAEVEEQQARADDAGAVLDVLPGMLGADGERVYLVVFTTPVEARGLGGFTANFAEITVRDGRISMSRFGRTDELDAAAAAGERTVTGPSDWLARYGPFGYTNGPGGAVGPIPFKNVTMSPLMSSTGEVIAELYPQSGGRPVDGVFAADVYVVAELLRFTGPIEVAGVDRALDADTAAEFLLNTQYVIESRDERIDVLDDVARGTVDRLLGEGQLLDPAEVLRSLGPFAEQGRLAGWATGADEQAVLEQVGLAGSMLPYEGDDYASVAFNNTAGSKIDYFLATSARYESTIDAVAGTVDGRFELTMENVEPSEPQPTLVVDNLIGEPIGTNQTWVSVYTAFPPSEVTLDGDSVPASVEQEAGYYVTSVLVTLPPGGTRTVDVRVAGTFQPDAGYAVVVRSPPAVGSTPVDVRLDVVDANGSRTIDQRLETAGVERIDLDLAVP